MTGEVAEEGPVTALEYLYEAGEHAVVIDLLIEILVAHGIPQNKVEAQLQQACLRYLEDQREQWWEMER